MVKQTWFALFMGVFVLNLLYSHVESQIYLSPTSNTPWSGECDLSCPSSSACRLPAFNITLSNIECNVHFQGGIYSNDPIYWHFENGLAIRATFESNVTDLTLSFNWTRDGPFELRGVGGGSLKDSDLTFVSATAGSKVKISDLDLIDVSVTTFGFLNEVEVVNSYIELSERSNGFYHRTTNPISAIFRNISVSSPAAANLIYTSTNISLLVEDAVGSIYILLSNGGSYTATNVTIVSSNLTVWGMPLRTNNHHDDYHFIVRESTISGTANPLEKFSFTFRADLSINDSIITGFIVGEFLNLAAVNVTFRNCYWFQTERTETYLENVDFLLSTNNSKLVMDAYGDTMELTLKRVRVNVVHEAAEFQISGNVSTTPGSSLATNRMSLRYDCRFEIDDLQVTELITGDGASKNALSTVSSISSWLFHSIRYQGVTLDMSTLGQLHYVCTIPTQGILGTNASVMGPAVITVFWPSEITVVVDTWFPIVSALDMVPSVLLQEQMTIDGFSLQSRADTDTVTFKLLYVGNTPCPEPPVGFTCINGVWVADGKTNSTTIVIVPGNGGVVQVVGNLTVTGPIVFQGTGSSLNVTGCVNTPAVEIEIGGNGKNVPTGPVTLIQQGKGCPNSIETTIVKVNQDSKDCKKITAKKDDSTSNPTTLSVVFSIDQSKCSSRSWRWIVLGTVLGVLVVAVVGVIVGWRMFAHLQHSLRKRLG